VTEFLDANWPNLCGRIESLLAFVLSALKQFALTMVIATLVDIASFLNRREPPCDSFRTREHTYLIPLYTSRQMR